TYVEAKEVNNRTLGNQLAEIRGNNTTIIAQNNINNIGARISGNENLNLVAIDGDIVNRSTVEKIEFDNGEFDRSKFTKIDSVGEIVSNGNLNILTNNYISIGAITQAKNANINVTNDINIKSQEVSGEQKFGKDDSQYNYYGFERNIGSVVKAENLNTTANNLNISGSAVTTKTANLNVDKLNIESKVDKEDEIRKSSYKSLLKSGSKKETIHNEENSAGSLYVENKGTIKGDVNLVGSNLVLGNDSFVGGKVTTDSRELHNSYSLEEKKKAFSGSIGSGGFSVGYGKSESKLKEKDLINAKSNLVLGDGTTLNKGADITATNLIHGNISINNGNVKFGARKDVKDIETSSKSSGINLSVKIKSDALDRAKQGVDSFKQMKSGDILGGIASSTNTVTGIVSGLASNQGTKLPLSAVNKNNSDDDNDDDQNNQDNTVGKDNLKAAQATNNFYANAGVNLGFNKSSSNFKSHSESGVVTTIRGKDENSSITYNNVKNIEYIGTQAQNTKFIYNNVENITKRAVELNNYSSSSSKSSGISTGVTIGYGDGVQTSVDAVKFSASKSKMNSNGTNFQNGKFVNVDEVHNNTKNMTLSGFNQEGGTVTGNIQNLTIESKQNTSTTTGSTKGGSLSIAPNGMPSGSASYSQTNGERRFVDSPTTFIIGDGSNLKVGKVENTAGAIGATGNGKLSIDEYVGHNLENVDKSKTVGGSVGISTSGINSIGINYNDRKQEGTTKNTVIGNVEIGKSSGDEINKDLGSMTEITKDRDFKTDINIESQTINYIKNPEAFKQDLKKAKNEIEDIGNVIENTVNPPGEDKRNFFKNLRAQRWTTSFYNVTGSRMEELSRKFKAGEIDENQLKEAVRELAKGYGKDIGIEYEVVYLDEETMPEDAKGSTGSSYILDKKNKKVLIPIDVSKIGDINELLGTLTEEISHGKDALEGRQDKKVAEDKSNDEEGLESLGRPANDYVKNKLGEDNNSKIKLSTDGIDLTNADVGEKVGDVGPLAAYVGAIISSPDLELDLVSLSDDFSLFMQTGSVEAGILTVIDGISIAIPGVEAQVGKIVYKSGKAFFVSAKGKIYKIIGKEAEEVVKRLVKTGKKSIGDVVKYIKDGIKKAEKEVKDVGNKFIRFLKTDDLTDILTRDTVQLTTGSKIGAKFMTENASIIKLKDAKRYAAEIDDIIKNGDLNGVKTEALFDKILKENSQYIVLDGKYGSNNGIDHLFIDQNTGTVWIVDSKQIASAKILEDGSTKVIENAAKNFRQLSPKWIKQMADTFPEGSIEKKILLDAIDQKNIKTGIVGVNKKTGDILLLPVEISNNRI
ncbi:hemagglutinin repeat-containing protein, partial [Fusobacterium polymorphum]|uniref:hemagglutinin repeat-containing protein n=2 Tax=Fusobacterium TaxID=848 RepID=UPI00300B2D49